MGSNDSCRFAQKGISIGSDGSLSFCSQTKAEIGNLLEDPDQLKNLKYNPSRLKFATSLSSGEKLTECFKCWEAEDRKCVSRRLFYKDKLGSSKEFKLEFLDVFIGNDCHLKCRMCNPNKSSSWGSDAARLVEKIDSLDLIQKPTYSIDRQLVDLIQSQNSIRFLNLTGGEPLTSQKTIEILSAFQSPELISVNMCSSLTAFSNEVISLLKRFKSVSIMASVEASGPMYQYVRGGKYKLETDVFKNIRILQDTLKEKLNIEWLYTANIYGVFDFDNLSHTLSSAFPEMPTIQYNNPITNPIYLNPLILDEPSKSTLLTQSQHPDFVKFINSDFEDRYYLFSKGVSLEQIRDQFRKYTLHLDKIRNENILAIESRFSTLLS